MQPRRIIGRSLAAFALLAVVACGDDDDTTTADATTTSTTAATTDRSEWSVDQDALDAVTQAVENTVDEGTAAFTVTVEAGGTGTEADGQAPIEAEGEVDFDNEMRRIVLVGPQGDLDVIIDGDVAYVELPATEGDDWMRIDLADLFDEDLGMGGPAGIPFQDPADNLRLLEASALHAAETGSETIDGTDTTRYELVIDIEAAADEARDDVQDAVSDISDRTGLQELEMEVWVDDDDLIRRVTYSIDLDQATVTETEDDADAAVEADPEGLVLVTVDYHDFGLTLDIEVPAEEDVIDLDEDAVRDAIQGESSGSDSTTTSTTDRDDDDDDGVDGDDDDSGTTTTSSPTTTTTSG